MYVHKLKKKIMSAPIKVPSLCRYVPNFLTKEEEHDVLQELKQVEYVPREQLKFRMYDSVIVPPRDQAFFGDVDPITGAYPIYRYPGIDEKKQPVVRPWLPMLGKIRDKINQEYNVKTNHCVINCYRNGQESISAHSDKTKDFIPGSSIFTVSLEATRTLTIHDLKGRKLKPNSVEYTLDSGSLLEIPWETNQLYKHAILKTKASVGQRTSLTYRSIQTIVKPPKISNETK